MSENPNCTGNCSSCKSSARSENCLQKFRLSAIRHKLVVMSGKGGVGKSTVAANLAFGLADTGWRVGLLDVDIHGPSIPKLLHLEGTGLCMENDRILPVEIGTLKVMSVGFMLEHADDAVIWRGPMKISVIQQMLNDVAWGELDCLVVDCPPGTGDEPLSICQMLGDADGAVIVTTPQQVAASDVAKSINFCRQLKFPIVGLIENMSGFVCPHCGEVTDIFASGGGEALASRYDIPFLGKIPLDPRVCRNSDDGAPFIRHSAATPAAAAFNAILQQLQLQMTRSEGTKL